MLKYVASDDGHLHSEKGFQAVWEEFATTTNAFRWRHLLELSRVTASAYGFTVDEKPDTAPLVTSRPETCWPSSHIIGGT